VIKVIDQTNSPNTHNIKQILTSYLRS